MTHRWARIAVLAAVGCVQPPAVDRKTAALEHTFTGPHYTSFDGAYSFDNTQCVQSRPLVYYEPADPGPHPIAIYLSGTYVNYDAEIYHLYLQHLAHQGYVAASVNYGQYTWWCSFGCYCYQSKANCVFDADHEGSAVAVLDREADADPALGVVTWGHSQGGYMALMAGNLNPYVTRAVATGAANPTGDYDSCMLPSARGLASDALRLVLGEHDEVTNPFQPDDDGSELGLRRQLAQLTEHPECEGTGLFDCLQADGSGFYLVQDSEPVEGVGDHRFWQMSGGSPADRVESLDPRYANDAWRDWSLDATVTWLAGDDGSGGGGSGGGGGGGGPGDDPPVLE